MTTQEIVTLLTQAREAYYNSDEALMNDAEFDSLEERLREIDPQNPYFSTVGVGGDGSGKITHAVPMISMGKAKTVEDVAKWLKRLDLPEETEFCLQPKIDGLSAACFYSGGKLQYVATRGDGVQGQDVTHIASYIKDIPRTTDITKEDVEIRGELYLPRDTEYDTGGRPLRNNCSGLINRKEGQEDLKYVRFVCYQIVRADLSETETGKISLLKEAGFHTVAFEKVSTLKEIDTAYQAYIKTFRDKWLYETDGLILTVNNNALHEEIDSRWVVDHHHHFNIAIKPPAQGKETVLENIEWQISRQGHLVPVACFKSIELGGAQLSRASLHNYQFARTLQLKRGDTLLVERANDVIPYIRENINRKDRDDDDNGEEALFPSECPACNSPVENSGVHLRCTNRKCPERIIQSILYWVKNSGIDNVAEATIRQLLEKGKISSVKDIYTLKAEDFSDLEGFAEKKIENFLSQTAGSKSMGAQDLISRLGIPLVQKRSLRKLNINTLQDFLDFNDDSYVIGQNIINWREDADNRTLLNDLVSVLNITAEQSGETKGTVCMTGKGPMGRKELIARIEELGYEFSSSVTKETTVLLTDNPEGGSSKLQKARKNGTKIISYTEFLGE